MPVKIHKIKESDSQFIGISSHQSDYKLSWAINKSLSINLTHSENDVEILTKGQKQNFSKFFYEDTDSLILYSLISNIGREGYLIPQMKNIDFVLKISGDVSDRILAELIPKLNRIEFVHLAFKLENLPKTKLAQLNQI